MLKTAATGGLLAMLTFMAYAPLNAMGLPPFSRQIGLLILAASYMLVGTVYAYLHHRGIPGSRQALIHLGGLIAALLIPAAYWVFSRFLPLPPLSFRLGMMLFAAGFVLFGFYKIFIRPADL